MDVQEFPPPAAAWRFAACLALATVVWASGCSSARSAAALADTGADAHPFFDAGDVWAAQVDAAADATEVADAKPVSGDIADVAGDTGDAAVAADSAADVGADVPLVAPFPKDGAWFHDLWSTPSTTPASASNAWWAAQYEFVPDTTADTPVDLSAKSLNLKTFSTSEDPAAAEGVVDRWGQKVFMRKDGCCVTNAATALETHPSWAVAKTFTAPQAGWYHLRAEAVAHLQCNAASIKAVFGDGMLLEVYAVRAGVTERIWAALLSARNCDPANISLNEYLQPGDRLVLRGVTHSGDSQLDGLILDPVVQLVQAGGAPNQPPCSVALAPTGNLAPRENDINAAIGQAKALLGPACPRAEVVLQPGDYALGAPVQFPGETAHITVRGDTTGTRARLLMLNRTAHILEMWGLSNELRGLEFDYATVDGVLRVPFTQGAIEKTDTDGTGNVTAVYVRIDKGFDNVLDNAAHDTLWQTGPSVQGVVFAASGAAKTYAWFDGAGRTFVLDDAGRWKLPFGPQTTAVQVGDRAVILARGFGGTFNVGGRENRLTDVGIHASAELVIRTDFATGLHARRLAITPGPAVGGIARLTSANADGLHLKNMRRGATIEDCELAGLPEDAINTHADGQFAATATFAAGSNQPEDWYFCYDSATLQPGNGGALVQPLSDPAAKLAAFGNRFFNISASGEGTLLRDCRIHELRGNGVVLRGGVALLTRNQFWNVFGGADPQGNNPWGRAVNLETQLAACAGAASCGNDEGPYAYAAYIRHNQLLSGNPVTGLTWYASYTPVIRNQPGAEGCWPWNGGFTALCYPENQDPAKSEIVTTPNP